ncbi:hypothetical protein VF21_05314 [Pseudogymnoascus sp. 05NY08]|nr:hypothetical protein VF21_05314 [Pseudogymnoascus sp. 05NY08]
MSTPDPADPFASPTSAAPAPAPAARKSLFKNRNRGGAATATTTDAIGFFSRAKDVFAENVEVQRREREREKEREREREREKEREREREVQREMEEERVRELERKRSEKRERGVGKVESGEEEVDSENERRRKRSRSEDRSNTPDGESEYGDEEASRSIEREGSIHSTYGNSVASPGQSQRNTRSQAHIISLSSDDEDDKPAPSPRPTYPSAFSSPPPKPLSTNPTPIAIPSSPPANPPSDDDELYADLIAAARRQPATTAAAPSNAPDPTLTILITSPLPNTTPLLIRRRLSQRLKDVRLAWCVRQPPHAGAAGANIFLTYRGLRVWDTSTCGSMGVKISRAGGVLDDGGGGEGGDVHLEAWTREAFEAYKAAEEERARNAHLGLENDDSGVGGVAAAAEAAPSQQQPQEEKLRIILRAKDMPEVKLRVKVTTKIADLVAAFRAQREAEVGGRSVELWFDGDRMEEDDCVGDADLEDLSGVDVVVR